MKLSTAKKLCCPFDKANVDLTIITKDVDGNIIEGYLNCIECQRFYPIITGIPIMNPDEYREYQLEKAIIERWEKHLEGKSVVNYRLLEA